MIPDIILEDSRITTLDPAHPDASELVMANGKIVGNANAATFERGQATTTRSFPSRPRPS